MPEDFTPQVRLLSGDAREELERLPDGTFDCVMTSPPYYLQDNIHDDRQIGREKTVDACLHRPAS